MRCFLIIVCFSIFVVTACDPRSETAKRSMERFTSSPTPQFSPAPTESPMDPADVATTDTSVEGEAIYIDGPQVRKAVTCSKFNPVKINGDANIVTIKGICRQVMINGDKNAVTADAAMEFVFNGSENVVKYARFVNGKRPTIIQNRDGNSIEKVSVKIKR